jgi:hypothetical protein
MSLRVVLVAVALIFAASVPAFAQEPAAAGRVKVVSGEAYIVRAGKSIPAKPGQPLFASDNLRTGADGSIGVTLKDATRLSLGPSSELRVERFVYAPESGSLAVVIKFMRGVGAYVSGRIAKLAPDAIRLETPAAIVGVRGTTVAVKVEPQ